MDFTLKLSLEHVTAVHIAVTLWTQRDVRDVIRKGLLSTSDFDSHEALESAETVVLAKISQLQMPKNLRVRLEDVVKSVGFEILDFYKRIGDEKTKLSAVCCLNRICWTSYGTIDRKRTVESFLNDQNFNGCSRYQLACKYMCEGYIPTMWKQLSETEKKLFSRNRYQCACELYRMLAFMPCYPEDEMSKLIKMIRLEFSGKNIFECLAECSIRLDTDVPFKYFWGKLNGDEKRKNVLDFAVRALNGYPLWRSDVLLFLLSQMNLTQLMVIFEDHCSVVLQYLFEGWCRQELFLSTVKAAWKFLSGDDYLDLLEMIAGEMNKNEKGNDKYEKMFEELWIESPFHLKEYAMRNVQDLVSKLLAGNNMRCIKLIVNDLATDKRRGMIFSENVKSECVHLIWKEKWEFLKEFVKFSLTREEDLIDYMRNLACEDDCKLCCDLIIGEQLPLLEKLLTLSFYLEDEVREFKRQLAYRFGKKICNSLTSLNKPYVMEEFLAWSLSRGEELRKFKIKIFF